MCRYVYVYVYLHVSAPRQWCPGNVFPYIASAIMALLAMGHGPPRKEVHQVLLLLEVLGQAEVGHRRLLLGGEEEGKAGGLLRGAAGEPDPHCHTGEQGTEREEREANRHGFSGEESQRMCVK